MNSKDLYQQACGVMPGGVCHELRYRQPHPIYIDRAQGAEKWDVEGKRYIDFKMGSASQLLGHSHPVMVEAIQQQAEKAIFTADCHALEVAWAEWIQRLFASAELTRFTASGTESTMLAMRLGRAWSGKDKVVRLDGHFHGWHDHALKGAKAGSNLVTSLGVPTVVSDLIEVCDATGEALQMALCKGDVGTVIVEASGANYGCVPLATAELQRIHDVARQAGVVLIFDEVITGFRWSPGGRQGRDGIVPDLTTLAKVAPGGLPGGAVCGRGDIMQLMNNAAKQHELSPPVSHKGTFNGSPLVAAAALAAMPLLATGEVQDHATAMAQRMREGMNSVLADLGVAGHAYGDASIFHVHFGHNSLLGLSAAQIRGIQPEVVAAYRNGMLAEGIDMMAYTSGLTSWAHSPALIDESLAAFRRVITSMLAAGLLSQSQSNKGAGL